MEYSKNKLSHSTFQFSERFLCVNSCSFIHGFKVKINKEAEETLNYHNHFSSYSNIFPVTATGFLMLCQDSKFNIYFMVLFLGWKCIFLWSLVLFFLHQPGFRFKVWLNVLGLIMDNFFSNEVLNWCTKYLSAKIIF